MSRRRHLEQSDADDRFLANPTIRWSGQECLLRGEPRGSIAVRANGRLRRVSPIPVRPGEGRITEATAVTQPAQRELVFVPVRTSKGEIG